MRFLVLAAVITMVIGCAPKPAVVNREIPPGTPPLHQRMDLGVPRGSITYMGRIMSISPVRSSDSTDVCAIAPCTARVQIQNITMIGYGGPVQMQNGDEVTVIFPMTVLPITYEGVSLPGLNVGDTFRGMAFEIVTMQGNALQMTGYTKP